MAAGSTEGSRAGGPAGSATGTAAEVTGRLWLEKGRRGFLGRGRIELLRRIGEQGSIARAARAMGMGEMRIAFLHVLPNTLAPFIVLTTARLGSAIRTEAALSFLGLGIPEPYPSWGRMLADSQTLMGFAPGLAIFPGLAIVLTVLGLNLMGDGLRDALDPRLRRRA